MDFAQLAGHVGEEFTLAGIPAILASATPNNGGGSLVFEGPLDPALEQATYELVHPGLGTGPLFVVPIGVTASARSYQAIFG